MCAYMYVRVYLCACMRVCIVEASRRAEVYVRGGGRRGVGGGGRGAREKEVGGSRSRSLAGGNRGIT